MLVQNSCYLNNPQSRLGFPAQQRQIEKNDVSFCGAKTKYGLLSIGALVLAYLGINAVHLKKCYDAAPRLFESEYPKTQIKKESGWLPTTRVLASVGQNAMSAGVDNDNYAIRLVEMLSRPDIKTIEQASDMLMKNGYKVKPSPYILPPSFYLPAIFAGEFIFAHRAYFPIETYGSQLGIFNKEEQNKERFVLNFYDGTEQRFSNAVDKFYEKMRGVYNLKPENVMKIPLEGYENIEQGVDSVLSQINRLKDRGTAELLIVYHGHGNAFPMIKGAEETEGAMEGIIKGISEWSIKDLFREKLKDTKTLLLLDTCYAGAWIADNASTALRIRG